MTAVLDVVDEEAERAEWLAWRRQGVGASDVAGILGVSPWSSPFKVWANKVGLLPDFDGTKKMRAGKYAELMIRPYFEDETGLFVVAEQARIEWPTNPVHRATIDGLAFDRHVYGVGRDLRGDNGNNPDGVDPVALVEMKNEASKRWARIPTHYATQGQWQMHCAGLERLFFAVLHWGWDLQVYPLDRNQTDIDFMVRRVDEFWSEHVVTGTPPPIDDSEATADALDAVYPGAVEETVDMTDMADRITEWRAAKAKAGEIADRVRGCENEIKARLGNATTGTVGDALAVSWRPQSRTTVANSKALIERGPSPRVFTSTTTFRVLRHHKPKAAKR